MLPVPTLRADDAPAITWGLWGAITIAAARTQRPVQRTETVPAYAADPGDHDVILDQFLAEHDE